MKSHKRLFYVKDLLQINKSWASKKNIKKNMKAEFIENLIKVLEDFPQKDILHFIVFEILLELSNDFHYEEKTILANYFL